MSKFKPSADFGRSSGDPQPSLLPLRFTRLSEDKYVLTNMVGEYAVTSRATLDSLANGTLSESDPQYLELRSKHFFADGSSTVHLDLLALKTRTRYQRLQHFTGLHMFVVSLRCEHSCPYCQVSRQSDDRTAFDMTQETADKAIDLVFRSPSPLIKIEFQGGEPLLNFPLINHIVRRAVALNQVARRDLQFVIATNLALVNDEILAFCREFGIYLSTSLDGPADLHNANRPRPGRDSYQRAIQGISLARTTLGENSVSALMTTTRASLGRARDIIDEYRAQGFNSIFLRPLSPYGFAIKTKSYASYTTDEWLTFYLGGLHYILELNKQGIPFQESYASIILTKMLTPLNSGYVDLMSPAGIGIAAVVYNYDGDVYASDESRMLAEMGDKTFCLGNVHTHTYRDIFLSDALLTPLEESFAYSAPMCSDCAFEPYCGADPVYHHAVQGDFVGRKPTSGFCSKQMGVFRELLRLLDTDEEVARIFRRWAAQGAC